MKRKYVFLVFFVLLVSTFAAGIDSMVRAGNYAQEDVNRALAIVLRQCEPDRIDADTIRVYRSHIHEPVLRDTAYLSLTIADQDERRQPQLKANTGLTLSRLWSLSDQRASCTLLATAVLWLLLSLMTTEIHETYTERTETVSKSELNCSEQLLVMTEEASPAQTPLLPTLQGRVEGGRVLASLFYDESRHRFTVHGNEVHFTPMQRSLMELFMEAPDHTLMQQEICNRLWPKKPDASATLYTLIRRIKPVLHEATGLTIECLRGESYKLKIEN